MARLKSGKTYCAIQTLTKKRVGITVQSAGNFSPRVHYAELTKQEDENEIEMIRAYRSCVEGRLSGAKALWIAAWARPVIPPTHHTRHGCRPIIVSKSVPPMRSSIRPSRPSTSVSPYDAGTRIPASRAASSDRIWNSTELRAKPPRYSRRIFPSSQANISASRPSAIFCICPIVVGIGISGRYCKQRWRIAI